MDPVGLNSLLEGEVDLWVQGQYMFLQDELSPKYWEGNAALAHVAQESCGVSIPEIIRSHLDTVLSNCLWVVLTEQGSWTRWPPDVLSNLNYAMIPWHCAHLELVICIAKGVLFLGSLWSGIKSSQYYVKLYIIQSVNWISLGLGIKAILLCCLFTELQHGCVKKEQKE